MATHINILEQYAAATKTKVIYSPADIDSQDKVLDVMYEWCKQQGDIVVLQSGCILSSAPTARNVQNCKLILLSKGIYPGQVFASSPALISLLLASIHLAVVANEKITVFSEQQRHLREIVTEAINKDVSDIHIEVRQNYAKIRMRQHGELQLFAEWSEKLGREIASVAFNKETDHATSHFNPSIPQDASMPLFINNKNIRLRLASMPAHGGFDMVWRILTTGDEENVSLQNLGYTSKQIEVIKMAMKLPYGAIIIAGPTGSGKTTTLASCMAMVNPGLKVYSIEDPVEKIVPSATQVPVNTEKSDRSFASMGRAALRMDPDVIVLGEMRDEDTARVMIRASITGHLVLSTLHTNRATAIVPRLVDMNISPLLLSDSSVLRCLICQRLVAKLCQNCCIPLRESKDHVNNLNHWELLLGDDLVNSARARGKGCNSCDHTALIGRTVIAEVIWVDDSGRTYIQKCDTLGWERYLKENAWQDFNDHAIELIKRGWCDPYDIEKVIGPQIKPYKN